MDVLNEFRGTTMPHIYNVLRIFVRSFEFFTENQIQKICYAKNYQPYNVLAGLLYYLQV